MRIRNDIELQHRRSGLPLAKLLSGYGVSRSTYYDWLKADGDVVSRRFNALAVLPEEEQAVVAYRHIQREVGYRKLTWLMNDRGIAALSESAVYGVLVKHDLLGPWGNCKHEPAQKEYQHKPTQVHEHWHTDIAYVKVRGVFYFLIMMLDGYSRYVLDWELMTDMTSRSVQEFLQRVRERYPQGRPMLIHDNGSAFVSRDFKLLVSQLDIQQVFTRRNHPQTNGKAERLNGVLRQEALRVTVPGSFEEACLVIGRFVDIYNHQRLHAGIKYLRPADLFYGRAEQVLARRAEHYKTARLRRISINNQRKRAELSLTPQ